LNPDEPTYLYNKGQTLLDIKQYEESITFLNDYVKKVPKTNAYAHYYIGLAYIGLNEYEKALKSIDEALEIQPGNKEFVKDWNSCTEKIKLKSKLF